MRIRVIQAPSMPEAMRRLAAELGPDAVLLSSRTMNGGVEVTAAVDYEPATEHGTTPWAEPWKEAPMPATLDCATAPALAFHNIPSALLDQLANGPLEAMLAVHLRFGRLPELGTRPLLLLGPPGAGKTLTTVKLAARRVLGGEAPPLIVNTDQQRPGAAEQMTGVAEVLGARLAHAATPAAALQAIALRPPGGAVLIDTPGIDPFDPAQARVIAELIVATKPAVALVMPAGLDPAEAAELARAFRVLGATHLVPTRLDTARRMGGILAAASVGLILAEGGVGPLVTDGLMAMGPEWLAGRLHRRSHAAPKPASPERVQP